MIFGSGEPLHALAAQPARIAEQAPPTVAVIQVDEGDNARVGHVLRLSSSRMAMVSRSWLNGFSSRQARAG